MKSLTETYLDSFRLGILTTAHCWRITRQDGVVMGFTDWDQDLTFAGLTYYANDGFAPTDVDFNLSGVPQVTISSFLGRVNPDHLGGGVYDNATVEFMRVNVHNLPSDLAAIPANYDLLVKGNIGVISHGNHKYSLQFRGLGDRLKLRRGWQTQKECRYRFGDGNCGVNTAALTQTFSATGGNGRTVLEFNGTAGLNRYTGSRLQWTSGPNTGTGQTVLFSENNSLRLANPTIYAIEFGDTFQIHPNCLKTEAECQSYSNILNFGGEGNIPGQAGFAAAGGNQ